MCASYLQHLSGAQLAALQEAFTGQKQAPPRVEDTLRRPSMPSVVLKKEGLVTSYFGVPLKNKLQINGRIESIAEKPYYSKGEWERGVLPVSSFFEYDSAKHPIEMREEGEITFLATLHRGEKFLIVTREATEQTRSIHPRLPYLLEISQITPYLTHELSYDFLLSKSLVTSPELILSGQMRLF